MTQKHLQAGAEVIRAFTQTLPDTPGVYRMLNAKGEVLYIGKARNLKKRVTAYTKTDKHPVRLQRMIAQTVAMYYTPAGTEAEALLIETNLIKKLRPRYNILMRDDKSFPFILITDHDFPQVTKYRGAKKQKGSWFGPFASAGAVNETLAVLQRAFMLRNCPDTVFASRKRPCLQYQIKRCTAPCVNYVDKKAYAEQVKMARDFLAGKTSEIQAQLAKEMQAASDDQDYEYAAALRDRIRALTTVQTQRGLHVSDIRDADVFGLYKAGGKACIQVSFFRGGQNYGNRAYFPNHAKDDKDTGILSAFIAQFYSNKPAPKLILTSHPVRESAVLQEALSLGADYAVRISCPARGDKKKLTDRVRASAKESHARHQSENAAQARLLENLGDAFGLESPPERIEIYDNSHISGQNAVGAMVVATPTGFCKNAYRKFNIKNTKISPGDDYAMLREVFSRRFGRLQREDPNHEQGNWPDLVIIDGGKGQLGAARKTLEDMGISDIPIIAIAKGPDRNAGRERFFLPGRAPFTLEPGSPALYFLQRLRDEAHRFAIGSHRARRKQSTLRSPLDDIGGIGPKRKKALLHHFGSAKAVAEASVSDLESVDGISRAIAEKIYNFFNG